MKKQLLLGAALLSLALLTACGNSSAKSDSNSSATKSSVIEKTKSYTIHNATFKVPSSWTEKDGNTETTKYFYPKDGMLDVDFEETTSSIMDESSRKDFISGLDGAFDNFKVTNETKASANNYAWDISFSKDGKQYEGQLAVIDVNGGLLSFFMATTGDTFKNYENDYGGVLQSCNFELRDNSTTPESSSPKAETNQSSLDILSELAANSKSTNEIYVTGDITVGNDQPVTPGIYDLTITGGDGNIQGERKNVNGMFINWIGGATGNSNGDPSTIRIILFDGDILSFSNISKIKFTAVAAKVTPSTQLGIGNFIVGRDIPAGNYKLSTNMTMDPQFENLGWSLSIYNDDSGQSQEQNYNPGNSDVAVSLKDGEILTTTFDNSNYYETNVSSDNAKLIFTPIQ